MTRHLPTWSTEHDDLLRAEWAKNTPARDIAKLLTAAGRETSKNAILGRARRLGLGRHAGALGPKPEVEGIEPAVKRLDFSKPLPPTGCRWIRGDASGFDSKWCDAPVSDPGGSWCAEHRAMVFRPRDGGEDSVAPLRPQRAGTVVLFPTTARLRGAA